MEPKNLKDMETGDTMMLAREIQERTSVSQIYVKIDETTVEHIETGEKVNLSEEELVYPFEPEHAAKRP